jgi:Zn-dependent protease
MESTQVIRLIIAALPILIAITFHEVSHGYVAYKLGDPTAKFVGRLTLNPLAHIDLFGTIILPLMLMLLHFPPFGYAKPVPINAMNFRNPRQGMAISAAAGPVTNMLLAVASFMVWKGLIIPLASLSPSTLTDTVLHPFELIMQSSIMVNVVLAVFNMIPIPPLDGGRVFIGLLPQRYAVYFSKIEPFGFIIVVIFLYTGIANSIIMPFIGFFLRLFQVYY